MHQWLNCSSYSLFSRVTVWTWYLSASDKGQSSGPRVSPLFIRSWFMMPISTEDVGAVFPTHNVPLLHWHCGGRSKATENHAENWGHYCIIRSFPIFIQVVPSFLQQCKCTIARKEETDLYLVRNSDTTLHILLQTAISLTYRDYTSSPVRFSNYIKFLVYIIEKIMERNLNSAHILNQKEQKFSGDGRKAKKKRKISQ